MPFANELFDTLAVKPNSLQRRSEDERLLGHQPVGTPVRHLGFAPTFKGQADKGTRIGGGDEFVIVQHHGMRIGGAPVAVDASATRDRHPATSIRPTDDKPMFFMRRVNPVSGFDTAGQAVCATADD